MAASRASVATATTEGRAPGVDLDAPARATRTRSARLARGSAWAPYLLRRAAWICLLLSVLVLLTFLVVHLVPGDPARNIVGIDGGRAALLHVRQQLGLTEPILTQFVRYCQHLLRGDLGTSFVTGQPVTVMIQQRLPVTAELAGGAMMVVLVVGVPAGMLTAALQRNPRYRWTNPLFTATTSLFGAMPEYLTGTLFIYAVALGLHLLPAQGGSSLNEIILPTASIAFAPAAIFARLVRNETLAVLGQDYIMTAMSKRLPRRRLYVSHVLPNVLTSTLGLGGLLLVSLLGGTVVTENVFNIPGLGTEIVQSILQSDYPAIQGTILVLGILALVITSLVDVVLGLVDPRSLLRAT